ncbi:MAG: protein translocase subunit SecF [Candidatus Hydrothermarchaeota archaeon]
MVERFKIPYEKLMVIPVFLLISSLLIVYFHGLSLGVDLKGGTTVTILLSDNPSSYEIESLLETELKISDVVVRITQPWGEKNRYAEIDFPLSKEELDMKRVEEVLSRYGTITESVSFGASLSRSFVEQGKKAILIAFFFMAAVVFITFRTIVPAFAVILAAFSDIVVTLGVMSLLKIPVSLASIAALLVLIGYSVDTDILLTTRVLKRKKGSVEDRIWSAMETGLTTGGTTIAVVLIMYLIAKFLAVEVIDQIASVLVIGLFIDMINTWIQNAWIIKIYAERGKR